MATFEDIQKANETMKPVDIKGKSYIEVNQRVKAFRMLYPEGCIKTEMVSNENGVCVFKAEVYSEWTADEPPFSTTYTRKLSTGYAYEKEGSTFINRTSYIENAETSAVGRALGFAGFGIDTSIASAEEVENAQINQTLLKPITDKDKKALSDLLKEKGKKWSDLKAFEGMKEGDTLEFRKFKEAMDELKEM